MILSIVIPCYNGGNVLSQNLDSLLPQISKVGCNKVELIIVNNASTDNTQEVIDHYSDLYPNTFKSYKLKETIISQDNFRYGVSLSTGEFVLLLGDDDILSPFFLDSILPLLHEDVELLHYSRLSTDEDLKHMYLDTKMAYVNSMPIWKTTDTLEFLKQVGLGFNFMSSVIFKRTIWECGCKYVDYSKPYYGYYWYAILLFGLGKHSKIFINFPLVLQRQRQHYWSKSWALFSIPGTLSIFRDLDTSVPGVYDTIYNIVHRDKREFRSKLGTVIEFRSFYNDKYALFRQYLTKSEWMLLSLYLRLPKLLAKVLRKVLSIL